MNSLQQFGAKQMQVKNKDCWIMTGNCTDRFKLIPDNSIHLTVTSPPYDNLRNYLGNNADWNKSVWQTVIKELYRVTKDGGVVVWVVGDATVKGSESGTSFEQALYAKKCGFRLHDTMIYHKNSLPKNHNRYEQDFEYMFVFSKGKPRTFNPIRIPTKFPEKESARKNSYFSVTDEKMRSARSGKKRKPVGADKIRGNIWYIPTGKGHSTQDAEAFKHPAIYPEKLVQDHITSWSNVGDIIFDPFLGSGTTGKMAILNGRKFIGIELNRSYFLIARSRIRRAFGDRDNWQALQNLKPERPTVKACLKSLRNLSLPNLVWVLENSPNRLLGLVQKSDLDQHLFCVGNKLERNRQKSLLHSYLKTSEGYKEKAPAGLKRLLSKALKNVV